MAKYKTGLRAVETDMTTEPAPNGPFIPAGINMVKVNPVVARIQTAHKLIRDKGDMATAIQYCEDMIRIKQEQINNMVVYDREQISALHDSIMEQGAILSIIKKMQKIKPINLK